jgi:Sugar (and other) transporter
LTAYPCEIWQYSLRSRGLTVTWTSTVLEIFFNTFVNPIALEAIGWKYYLVFVVVLVLFGLTAYFFYPETRGHTLEQMAVIFDGEDAAVAMPAETRERTASVGSLRRASAAGVERRLFRSRVRSLRRECERVDEVEDGVGAASIVGYNYFISYVVVHLDPRTMLCRRD